MAELITEILVACIALFMFATKLRFVLDPQTRSRSTIGFTVFFGFVGLAFALQIDALYMLLGRYTLPNFGWYLSYLAITIGLYFLAEWRNGVEERSQGMAHLALLMCGLTIVVFSVVYWGFLQFTSESLNHNIPRSLAEVVYILAFHVYALVTLLSPLNMLYRMWGAEGLLAGRLRIGVLLVLLSTTWIWLLLKAIHILSRYFIPTSPLVSVSEFFPIFVAIIGVCIVISFLPNSLYVRTARAIDWLTDAHALLETLPLVRMLEGICPPVFYRNVPFSVQVKRPTLYLRRQVIFILDCRKTLSSYDTSATLLGEVLGSLEPSADYRTTVANCRFVSRNFARNIATHYLTGKLNALLNFKTHP